MIEEFAPAGAILLKHQSDRCRLRPRPAQPMLRSHLSLGQSALRRTASSLAACKFPALLIFAATGRLVPSVRFHCACRATCLHEDMMEGAGDRWRRGFLVIPPVSQPAWCPGGSPIGASKRHSWGWRSSVLGHADRRTQTIRPNVFGGVAGGATGRAGFDRQVSRHWRPSLQRVRHTGLGHCSACLGSWGAPRDTQKLLRLANIIPEKLLRRSVGFLTVGAPCRPTPRRQPHATTSS